MSQQLGQRKTSTRRGIAVALVALVSSSTACAQQPSKPSDAGSEPKLHAGEPRPIAQQDAEAGRSSTHSLYTYRAASRDGIGKIYMGREISQVMGHLGASWLERPERVQEERTDLLIELIDPQPGEVIVDLGAGSGYFSLPLARAVGPEGKILAVDIQPEMLALLEQRQQEAGIANIQRILASESDPNLSQGVADKVILVDVYHELSHPREVLSRLVTALRPGGRIYFVEYRAEDPSVPIKRLHKMSEAQVRLEAEQQPLLRWERTFDRLPQQHVVVFRKLDESAQPLQPRNSSKDG